MMEGNLLSSKAPDLNATPIKKIPPHQQPDWCLAKQLGTNVHDEPS